MRKISLILMLLVFPLLSGFGVQLSAGLDHSLALKEDGTVWAWGENNHGQLGDGTTEDQLSPARVVGFSNGIAIAAGYGRSFALKRDGTVWAWGAYTSPYDVGLSGIIAIDTCSWTARIYEGLALKNDGTVWTMPSLETIDLSEVIAIASGAYHSLALKRDGTVWAWGDNTWGQLGDGTGTNSSTPVTVSGLTDVIAIDAGTHHSLALKRDGTVWLWGVYAGANVWEWVGFYTPQQIYGLPTVVDIEATDFYSLALASDGTVWFFGRQKLELPSGYGQRTAITFDEGTNPVPFAGISEATAIAAGAAHVLFLKNDGTLWAWGDNYDGRLGDGTGTSTLTPVRVKDLTTDSSDPIINPDVKVNNVDGPLTVSAFTPITVTVQISPAYLGLEADWWIAAQGGGNWFYLTLEDFLPKWTAMTDYTEMQPIAQGPLAPIGPVPIIESEYWLPRGDYEFFFAVDTVMDGILTLEALHYDSALLTIK